MTNKIYLNSTFSYREDTLKNWQTANPVLERGEISFVRDGYDGKFVKIGDGHTPWNTLPYAPLPKGEKGEQGLQGEKGVDGKDYVLTEADREEIADMAKPVIAQTYSPESENAQSGKAVAEALANAGGEKTWTLLHDITLTEAVDGITLDTNCKEVYVEGIFNMSEDNAGQPVSVFFQPKSGKRLTNGGVTISASALKLYMRGEISLAPNGRLKGLLNVDANSLGYTKYSVESTLSQNFANAEGNISGINIQLSNSPVQALMEIGSTIKVWGR